MVNFLKHKQFLLAFTALYEIAKTHIQSWALALFFQVRSPLNLYPWIAIAHFAHFEVRSIALKKTSGSLLEKSAKTLGRS